MYFIVTYKEYNKDKSLETEESDSSPERKRRKIEPYSESSNSDLSDSETSEDSLGEDEITKEEFKPWVRNIVDNGIPKEKEPEIKKLKKHLLRCKKALVETIRRRKHKIVKLGKIAERTAHVQKKKNIDEVKREEILKRCAKDKTNEEKKLRKIERRMRNIKERKQKIASQLFQLTVFVAHVTH
ncbi:Oidioi.mRNA.OKI2018_I69.XSR.g14910.t1.cds [Oikopleura dioica]|uniref:Oidioi.mRNA.OKI2018_I69.XSR.g14910.t1.cds n=1 Tax=Oikopleura dioica TaxID=34765 RepID=A0ABN7SB72_OIKDI|nr:Oidioi.mRNA.OKI2018_I69.XSR.g14910.t1.cds [Oikopleura dioica]